MLATSKRSSRSHTPAVAATAKRRTGDTGTVDRNEPESSLTLLPAAAVRQTPCDDNSDSSSPLSPAACVRPTPRDDNTDSITTLCDVLPTPRDDNTATPERLTLSDQSPKLQPTPSPQSYPASPAASVRDQFLASPAVSVRDKFMANLYVQTVGCCLDSCSAGPSVRLSFKGTIAVLYPINFNPERRYVVFMDESGNLGLTIWNKNIAKITTDSIGKNCEITKVTLTTHQGKKVLSLSKESDVRNQEHTTY